MNKNKTIDLTNIGEKHSKKTEKMFKIISKKNDGSKVKAYEYKCKSNENIIDGNILTYPTELLLGLKELKNNPNLVKNNIDILTSDIATFDKIDDSWYEYGNILKRNLSKVNN